jgi:hypothetical protein
MGLEPTTFCMATRPSLPQCATPFRLTQAQSQIAAPLGCGKRQQTAPN